ncbi:N-acetyltransferase [Putridiphycobacter roseus]|uniref:N-acetyltransferase n=1 Tax=Putridiphycobacter roseus TaxID=2219161 RepID=A0A2W1NBV8_9FLAO|nr:GNAT family protein [Putridiphycobacter roseus]PZE16815.1 N-acetyltransferase [Putridiphycobacter roseus]
MEEFPTIKTKRLFLRRITLSDLTELQQIVNNKNITDQLLNFNYPYTKEDALKRFHFVWDGFQENIRYVFLITDLNTDGLLGEIGLHIDSANNHAEIGYWVAEDNWGKGIAKEATKAILKFGFETLKLHKIFATHFTTNPVSGGVLIANKMIKEGVLKDHYLTPTGYQSVIQYRLTKTEYDSLSSI